MTNNINPLMDGNPSSLSEPGARGQEDLRRGVMARFRLRHALRRRPTRPRGARTIPKTGVTANAATARARRPPATTGYRGRRYPGDRKSVVEGKSVSGRVDLGGGRILKKKNKKRTTN